MAPTGAPGPWLLVSRVLASRLLALVGVALVAGQVNGAGQQSLPKRAAPPKVWSQDVLDAFFSDARDALVGERPEDSSGQPAVRAGSQQNDEAPADAIFAWSKIVSPETIEDEVKRYKARLAQAVTTPSAFKGGGHQQSRMHFSTLAVLFAVAGEYDQDVRWKENAPTIREQFARTGFNCKVGTDDTYQDVRRRLEDLQELVQGGRMDGPEADRKAEWAGVADRPQLMKRMEEAYQERLSKWLAAASGLKRNADDVRHEAQLLALIAEVITRESYELADDEEYLEYAHALRDAATDVAAAAERGNYAQAREAAGRITKSCSACHDLFR